MGGCGSMLHCIGRHCCPWHVQKRVYQAAGIFRLGPEETTAVCRFVAVAATAKRRSCQGFRIGCLRRKVQRYRPAIVALVGVTVFRAMFPERKGPVVLGPQDERLGRSVIFVLPNPSGRNANYTYAQMLAAFRDLAHTINRGGHL